ncbi:CoxG family protein [Halegenticoccus tardaugens]|uniref:CoxG family protein n=1 Tax=Halegenticoccus tardaugens TaxID=2071624 RepID=UPI00100A6F2D|nr:SRPBCC family protein [Halegenticoccus tardaugens]
MTVRVQRTFEFDADPERVWAFISDPEKRARAISVVEEYETDPTDDRKATWHIGLPIPLVSSTVAVDTEDVTRDPPRYVRFVGRSRALRVTGEHTVEPTDGGCRLDNVFVVDGRLPGVERFFKRNLDRELDNLEAALREELELPA